MPCKNKLSGVPGLRKIFMRQSWVAVALAGNWAGATAIATPTAEKILEHAELIRNPPFEYQLTVELMDNEQGKKDHRKYLVQIKGASLSRVLFTFPKTDEGTRLLMDNNDMWIFIPTSAKPVRISPRQKLMGNAAYGDVARLTFQGNYSAKIKKQSHDAYVLDLEALKNHPVTYDRIEYHIRKRDLAPVSALYMTPEGRVLRQAFFEKYQNVFGVPRPTVMRIVDKMVSSHVTTLIMRNQRKRKLADILFDKSNFTRDE